MNWMDTDIDSGIQVCLNDFKLPNDAQNTINFQILRNSVVCNSIIRSFGPKNQASLLLTMFVF